MRGTHLLLILTGQYDPSLPSASQQYIKSFDTKVDVLTVRLLFVSEDLSELIASIYIYLILSLCNCLED